MSICEKSLSLSLSLYMSMCASRENHLRGCSFPKARVASKELLITETATGHRRYVSLRVRCKKAEVGRHGYRPGDGNL